MKSTLLLSLTFLFAQSLFSQKEKIIAAADGICKEDKWELKFEENFDGMRLNLNTWKNREYSQGSMSNEGVEVYCTLDNVLLSNGICKIIAKTETIERKAVNWKPDTLKLGDGVQNLRTYYHTASWIETRETYKYGKFEIRCKIPKEKGFWPAFWMYGQSGDVNNEIDVFEFWNPTNFFGKYNEKKLSKIHHMTVHYNKKMSGENYEGPDFSADFHTFSVVWDSTKIEWYVDGELKRLSTYYQTKRGKNVECKNIKAGKTYYINPIFPKDPMSIIANLAIQTGKNAPDVTVFNSAFEIDYIKYYKKVE